MEDPRSGDGIVEEFEREEVAWPSGAIAYDPHDADTPIRIVDTWLDLVSAVILYRELGEAIRMAKQLE